MMADSAIQFRADTGFSYSISQTSKHHGSRMMDHILGKSALFTDGCTPVVENSWTDLVQQQMMDHDFQRPD